LDKIIFKEVFSLLKTLSRSIRQYKFMSILTPIFTAGECALEVFLPFVTAKLIDQGIQGGDMNAVWRYGFILIALALLSLIVGALSGAFGSIASAGYARNLRHDMYYAVQNFSFSNIDKFSTASIVTRCTTDVTNLQNAYMMLLRIAVRCPVMLIFSMVMAFRVNSKLASIFVIIMPFLAVALLFISLKAHPIFERVFDTYDKLNSVVQENLRGIRVVKSFVREDHERTKFGKISQSIYKDFSSAEKLLAFNMPVMQLAIYGIMIIISWVGAKLIVTPGGDMTVGNLTSMMSYAMSSLMSLNMLANVLVMIILSMASAKRIAEILTEVPDLANPASPLTQVEDGSIDFNHVSFRYSKKAENDSLVDVDLHIASGETIGIIGGTGSSKSTLVQLIARLYDTTQGTVCVGGHDVKDYDLHALRDQVAMVLQKNVLFSGTIKENLRWGDPNATDEQLVAACQQAQADEFISTFPDGYDTYLEEGGTNVSGGQKQRLCIARALLKKPKILILDDSTSAVDTATDAKIRKAFRETIPNTTKIIIAQRISSIQDADRIIVMENGAIDGIGTHEELLKGNEIYREVYYSQQKGGDDNG
jgi:ATP-binding cassette subfamily B protein